MDKRLLDVIPEPTEIKSESGAFFIIDSMGCIQYVSNELLSIWGIDPSELTGTSIYDYVCDEAYDKLNKLLRTLDSNKDRLFSFEMGLPHIDGGNIAYTFTFSSFENKAEKGIILHITDNRNKESTLNELKKLSHAVEYNPATILITNTEGIIEYVNTKFTSLTGYTSQETVGKKHHIMKKGTLPLDRYNELWDTITQGKTWKGEVENRKKNGETYWELAQIAPIRDKNGTITNFIASNEDITELKKARDELKRQRNELSEFAHTVAHDLRNPITIINAYAQMIEEDYDSDMVQKIIEKTQEINDFIKKSLVLADAGKMNDDYEMVDLDKLVRSLAKEIISPDITYSQGSLPSIPGDKQRLRQVFQNLFSNATLHGKPNNIEVSSRTDENNLYIVIRNDGVPIDNLVRNIIFEKGISLSQNGTGLGLYIVKKIVDSLGGSIMLLESKKTAFEITLPKQFPAHI